MMMQIQLPCDRGHDTPKLQWILSFVIVVWIVSILLYFKMVYVAISCIYKACMSICWVLTLFDLIWWII